MYSQKMYIYGFTLVELLVAVLIVGCLSAIAIPVFTGQKAKAYDAKTKSNLMNVVKTFKDEYLPPDRYSSSSIIEAAKNEPAFHITGVGVPYLENQIFANVVDRRTIVLTEKSRSGKDFCLVSREEEEGSGVYRSWEAQSMTGLLAENCPATPLLVTANGVIPHMPEDEKDDEEENSGGDTEEESPSYGNYFEIRSNIGPDNSCGFEEEHSDNAALSCVGGASGGYRQNSLTYRLRDPSGIMGLNEDNDISPISDKYSVYFTGSNEQGGNQSWINPTNSMWISGNGTQNKAWSMEVWVKPQTVASSRGIMGEESFWTLEMLTDGFRGGVRTSHGQWELRTVEAKTNMQANKWYQLFMTWDNGELKLYVNGKLGGITNGIGPLVNGTPNVGLGRVMPNGNNNSFIGHIDEYSFYNKRLNDEDIKALYEAGSQTSVE